MTEITLADSSKQIHLTALAKATLLGVTEIGTVILSPSSPEILVGMDFLRRFNRALVVVDQIDVERILARNTAARRDPHAQLCNRSGKLSGGRCDAAPERETDRILGYLLPGCAQCGADLPSDDIAGPSGLRLDSIGHSVPHGQGRATAATVKEMCAGTRH